jgi:mannose PTS system EIIA component
MERLTAVVIVTHGNAGADMVLAAQSFLHMQIHKVVAVGVEPSDDQIRVDAKIDRAVEDLGATDDDILFLVDLVGSTPARLCCRRCGGGHVVTGVNMPMLLKLATADRSRGALALGDELVATGTKSIHHE